MARTTGTKNITPNIENSDYTVSAPGGSINLVTTGTGQVLLKAISGSITLVEVPKQLELTSEANVNNPTGYVYNPADIYGTKAQRESGSAYFAGGVGIEKDLNVGGYIYGRVAEATTSTTLIVESTNTDELFYPTFTKPLDLGGVKLYGDNTSSYGQGLTYNPNKGILSSDKLVVESTDVSDTIPADNSLLVKGGTQLNKDVFIGEASPRNPANLNIIGDILPRTDQEWNIGDETASWRSAWLENIYSKMKLTIAPQAGMTEVQGDIRVLGQNPIGTAPVVTNILYVTMDGNDTNDGRAMDASRACRTIGGAIRSPYYQPGTQIRVAPGYYLEDNPLQLKPYTSIMGSDIRTTSIEPINKTQDLFHLNSGCYLAFMQFLNGRSGLLEGPYEDRFNRGAYCTAFPPLEGDARIDLYHSPYVQNCTNLSGPWLKDGTLFTPNQTVQIPIGVGTGTWVAGTTTITVSIVNAPRNGFINAGYPGSGETEFTGSKNSLVTLKGSVGTANDLPTSPTPTIYDGYLTVDTGDLWVYTGAKSLQAGMAINAGQQNPGFFNARTLLLANKSYLQEQTISFITDQITTATVSSIWYDFDYSQEKCYRDVGILVENVGYDAAFGGNEKAIQSGLAYWNGVVSRIAGQEQQTTEAINYLRDRVIEVVQNTTCTNTYTGGTSQVINWVMTGGSISTASYVSLFDIITDIINDGPDAAPSMYMSPGPDAAFVSAEVLMQTNRQFIQQETISWINQNFLTFPYSEIKCRRDTGLIIDSIAFDMLYPTPAWSQSTFAGLQYWKQDTTVIPGEVTTTTNAVRYLKDLAGKIIRNITPADDLVNRYQTTYTQNTTSYQSATLTEVGIIEDRFDEIIEIISTSGKGWTDRIISNSTESNLLSVQNAVNNLLANKEYMAKEVNAYITATNVGFSYDVNKCERDVGYMVDAVAFDLLHGGNRQSVQAGLYYYSVSGTTSTIYNETVQTIAAFNYLRDRAAEVIQNIAVTAYQEEVEQITSLPAGSSTEAALISQAISTITNLINSGPGIAPPGQPIAFTATITTSTVNAFNLLYANKDFLIEETIAYIDRTYNPTSFNYDEAKCFRDVGLIVDAVSQDILLGGNQKSLEAGLAYWSAGYNYVAGQETTTTMAINHARDVVLQVIANNPVTVTTGTIIDQVINPFFDYGYEYGPQEAVKRNFNIITKIIENGPNYAPPRYAGGGIQALTGINGLDVKESPLVTAVNTTTNPNVYVIGLSTATIGSGTNATLYFGDTLVFPKQDAELEEISLEYTGSSSSWNQRKVDPIGSMGGSLVDGAVISSRSPIQSFVYDAFTQLTQGGRGIRITNNGYAQLVSVFTIFASTGVQVDNGGIASIVNSNANFGDVCLVAKGFGKRKFSGTIYNPAFKAFDATTGKLNPPLDQYYPNGFWPGNASVLCFLPDVDDRPHISLVMEVVPPEGHVNEQQLPGFLNAVPNTSTITTGSITISDIDTTGIVIGNSLYIRDQFGSSTGPGSVLYADTGTVVTDIGYRSVTLNKALSNGGGQVGNDKYFNLYFCGNAYYTVLSSVVGENPKTTGTNILSTASGLVVDQVQAHLASLEFLQNTLTNYIISNTVINPANYYNTTGTSQTVLPLVTGGAAAKTFIDLRFGEIKSILTATNVTAAEAVIPNSLRTKEGPAVAGAGSAITLITANIEFLADEASAYAEQWAAINQPTLVFNDFIRQKCQRDIKIILQRLIYDLETGGRYNSVMTGLSYWSRNGTHHVVRLGENVRRTDLFPDGASVNFYQRSYISASGYVFEYVGAGTNYGALPQVGRADPVQGKEVVQLSSGKVFFTSTDQNGDFRIGPGLVISQATGVLSGRTFTKSLFANMTPFILAIESGGG